MRSSLIMIKVLALLFGVALSEHNGQIDELNQNKALAYLKKMQPDVPYTETIQRNVFITLIRN
jgi:hypothetical protein